jgi:predicted P-loop ATPase
LRIVHEEVGEAVCRKIRSFGKPLSNSAIQTAANIYHKDVERELITLDEYKRDHKNEIQHGNSDNITVFLKDERLEIRWNAWLERMEIKGGVSADLSWLEWSYIDDTVVAQLMDWASRTDIGYRPAETFFWKGLITRSRRNIHDPARALLKQLEAEYDGLPRLIMWLSATCGVPCDAYHQAVGVNIIGGIVRRIRNPGCKHDTMPIFYGFQGSGKSTMASVLALDPEWFTDAVMLGDESKELVLSLAGKTVSEIGEMGMRGSADANRVKKMLSATFDEGRTAYARSVTKRQRRNIFIGTTNDSEPLTDTTGNRRFLPVHVDREIDMDWLHANIRALFAEAAVMESAKHTFAIPKDVWAIAGEHQDAARSSSDMEVMLDDWFAETPYSGPVSYVTAKDLAILSEAAGWRTPAGQRNALMKRMGFRPEKPMIGHKRPTVWIRGECRTADIPKVGVRYMCSIDSHGRPNVIIRTDASAPSGLPILPAPPY